MAVAAGNEMLGLQWKKENKENGLSSSAVRKYEWSGLSLSRKKQLADPITSQPNS